ncbi:MAG: sigma-70 family RNA polymerase sigma factor [Planctomycetota bacterium]
MTKSNQYFASTHWTLIWKAAKEDAHQSQPALEELIRCYWPPLYSFARQRGLSREDAEDATQEFLSGLVRGEVLHSADPAKGKFRSFLLVAWRRFLIDEYRRRQTQRRGGNVKLLSVDFGTSEKQWLEIHSRDSNPDRLFNLFWAKSLLDEVRRRLKEIYDRRDRGPLFDELLPRVTETLTQTQYVDLAERLSLSPSAVKVAMHRLRQRFGQTLREVVLETLDDESEIDAELSELRSVLAGAAGAFDDLSAAQSRKHDSN